MASLFLYKVFESLNTKCFGVTLYVARYYYIIVHSYGKRQQEPTFRCYACDNIMPVFNITTISVLLI